MISRPFRAIAPFVSAFLAAGLLRAPPALAIVNVEDLRLKLRHKDGGGKVGFSFDRREGNTDMLRFLLNGQALERVGETENLALVEREFGQSASVQDVDRFFAHGRTSWPTSRVWRGEAYAQAEQNQFTRLLFRGLGGAGVRARFQDDETSALYAGLGAFWSRETLGARPGTTDDGTEDATRVNAYLSAIQQVSPNSNLTAVVYYQPKIGELGDTRVLVSAQLEVKATEHFTIALPYSLAYDSRPPQQVQTYDQEYGTVLTYTF